MIYKAVAEAVERADKNLETFYIMIKHKRRQISIERYGMVVNFYKKTR